jgi:phosphate transport system substrate-binding protein
MSSARAKDCPMLARGELTSIQLGRDAIVLAMRADSQPLLLNTYDIYRAIARDVPAGDEFRRNVAIRWSDIDPALPQKDIRFQLPPAHDHRRHIFDTLILEGGCRKEGQVKGIYEASLRTARCVTTRMDRVREIAREHAIRSLLDAPPGTIGVLSYQELEENADKLVAIPLDGVMPTDLTIQEGTYSFATSKWLFAQRGPTAVGADSRVQDEITRLTMLARSEAMIGPNGAIIRTGLVPLAADEREGQRAALADAEHPIDLAWFANWVFSATASTWNMASYAVGDMRASEPKNAVDLAKLMDIAGYKLAEFESSIGLIPSAAMTFKITREMSESDRDYLERELYKDSRQRRGIRSALQRWLIRTIIDISDSDDYQVSKVEVKLLPLPAVNLRVTPQGYGSGSDAATVLRAIERLQDRLPETLQ